VPKLLRDLLVNLAANGLWQWGGSTVGGAVIGALALVAGLPLLVVVLVFLIVLGLLAMVMAELQRRQSEAVVLLASAATFAPSTIADRRRRAEREVGAAAARTAPLTLQERTLRYADELEEEVAKRDRLPHRNRQMVGDSYRAYLAELRTLAREIMQHQGYLPGELNVADGHDMDRAGAIAVVHALRGIVW